jgi:hypothetical protein
MYLSLKLAPLEDLIEVLPHLSQEQWVAIFDRDAWHNLSLARESAFQWIELYREHGVEQMFTRYKSLDEEYQIALLSQHVEMVDEDAYESLGDEVQDTFIPLPCNTLWYRIIGFDDKTDNTVEGIIAGGLGHDLAYTYSLLQHATMLPPHEQEHLLQQFRTARLEEDGFSVNENVISIFKAPPFRPSILDSIEYSSLRSTSLSDKPHNSLLLTRVLDDLKKNQSLTPEKLDNFALEMTHFLNQICAVSGIESHDVDSLRRIAISVQGIINVGLEDLSGGDELSARQIFLETSPKKLYTHGLSIVSYLRQLAIESLHTINPELAANVKVSINRLQFGKSQWDIETTLAGQIDLYLVEFLKGLFNRHPLVLQPKNEKDGSTRASLKPLQTLTEVLQVKGFIDTLSQSPNTLSGVH